MAQGEIGRSPPPSMDTMRGHSEERVSSGSGSEDGVKYRRRVGVHRGREEGDGARAELVNRELFRVRDRIYCGEGGQVK